MSGIQKRGSASIAVDWSHGHDDGPYVTYADHLAAVAEAEQRAYKRGLALARGEAIEHYQQGAAASLREALAVLEKHRDDNYLPGSSDWIHVDWALGQVKKLIDNEEKP